MALSTRHEPGLTTLLQHFKIGWEQLLSDRCVFVLRNSSGRIVGLAGLHVDDFIIGGLQSDECFQTAQTSLEQAYRWGKWEQSSFTFAGVEIEQLKDGTIKLGQRDYTDRWMDVIEMTKEREAMKKSLATPEEISALRGAIGTVVGELRRHHHSLLQMLAFCFQKFHLPRLTHWCGQINSFVKCNVSLHSI